MQEEKKIREEKERDSSIRSCTNQIDWGAHARYQLWRKV